MTRRQQATASDDVPPRPPSLSDRMRHNMGQPPQLNLSETLQASSFPTDAQMPIHPAARIMEMILFHGDEAAWEQLDHYLLQFQLRATPIDRVARNLDVDVKSARRIMREFKQRMDKQMEKLEVNQLMHRSMGMYDYLQSRMFNQIDNPNATFAEQCLAQDRIMKAERDRYRMLEHNRYYERKGYQPKEPDSFGPRRQSSMLKDMLENLLLGNPVEDTLLYQEKVRDVEPE